MMKNSIDQNNCSRFEEMVPYIYNELPMDERDSFETHLSACTSCTDEFAALADARYSVFEWHKEEFVNLPTPTFTIPSSEPVEVNEGFWGSLAAAVRGFGWAVPVSVLILLSIGVTVYLLVSRPNNPELAQSPGEPATAAVDLPGINDANGETVGIMDPTVDEKESNEEPALNNGNEAPVAKPKRALFNVKVRRTPRRSVPATNKIVLSSYEDIEDRSLRLSDLLNEVGG